jgi:hypothetical protein
VRVLYEGPLCVAQRPNGDAKSVAATLSDLDILEPLQATLRMIGKLTRAHAVDVEGKQAVLAVGASRQQIEAAFAVCFSFNVIGRLADAFGFVVPRPRGPRGCAKYILVLGYR